MQISSHRWCLCPSIFTSDIRTAYAYTIVRLELYRLYIGPVNFFVFNRTYEHKISFDLFHDFRVNQHENEETPVSFASLIPLFSLKTNKQTKQKNQIFSGCLVNPIIPRPFIQIKTGETSHNNNPLLILYIPTALLLFFPLVKIYLVIYTIGKRGER